MKSFEAKFLALILVMIGLFIVADHLDRVNPKESKVVCKVCHCGKEFCARSCSEENMCQMRCEKECKR